jgi:hypothetical protein
MSDTGNRAGEARVPDVEDIVDIATVETTDQARNLRP